MELTEEQRQWLKWAVDRAADAMFNEPDEFDQPDWDAYTFFERLAKGISEGQETPA